MIKGYQVWSKQQIAETLRAIYVAQTAILQHIPTEKAIIYQAAQKNTLYAIATAFGLEYTFLPNNTKLNQDTS